MARQRQWRQSILSDEVRASSGWIALGVAWLACACGGVTTVDLLPVKADSSKGGGAGSTTSSHAGAATGGVTAGAGTTGGGGIGSWTTAAAGGSGSAGASSTSATVRLLHRYDFSGTGTVIVDSVGASHGEAMGGAVLDGSGQLHLDGDPSRYVRLPPKMISTLTSATIVAVVTWSGGNPWQRIFDFGSTKTGAPAEVGDVTDEFFLTTMMQGTSSGPSLHLNTDYGNRNPDSVDGADPFPINASTIVVSVFDGLQGRFSLYINGNIVIQPRDTKQRLVDLNDSNSWLGLSQWAHDNSNGVFRGSFDEFRIYDGVMSAEQIRALTDPNVP